MSDIIKAVTNPLGLIVLILLLTFGCLQALLRAKESKQLRRVSYFAFGYSLTVLGLAILLYFNDQRRPAHSVVHVRIADGEGKSVPGAILMRNDLGFIKANARGELDVPLASFGPRKTLLVDLAAEGFGIQTARLDAGALGARTLTMSSKGAHVRVRVVDEENKPRTMIKVRLLGTTGDAKEGLTSFPDGIADFLIPPGTSPESQKIEVNVKGYEPAFVPALGNNELTQIKLAAKHMNLHITVVDEQTNRPIPNADVEIVAFSRKSSNPAGICQFDVNLAKLSTILVNVTKTGYERGYSDIAPRPSVEEIIKLKSLAPQRRVDR
jgi:hypothetical protein